MLKLQTEFLDHGVFQRNAQGFCRTCLSFTGANPKGRVKAFYHNGTGSEEQPAGETVADEFGTGRLPLSAIPVGGPYTVRILEKECMVAAITDILVGDVWLLAGQSNMSGCGKLSEAEIPSDKVRCFGFNNAWRIASGRLHNLSEYREEIYARIAKKDAEVPEDHDNSAFLGVGPGHSFALSLAEESGVPQGVIAGAIGSACLEDWNPERRTGGADGSYYGALLERVRLAGGNARGLFWYQGEADTREERSRHYAEKTRRLFNAFRTDFGFGNFCIVMAQLGCYINKQNDLNWSSVREQQRLLQDFAGGIAVVPAFDLDIMDGLHLTAGAAKKLGRRVAEVMRMLMGEPGTPGLYAEPDRVCSGWDPEIKAPTVEVTFRNLAGNLRAAGRPMGFLLHRKDGMIANSVSFIELSGTKAVIHLSRSEFGFDPSEKYQLSYGGICNPAVNITDGIGRPLLGFGPLPIEKKEDKYD